MEPSQATNPLSSVGELPRLHTLTLELIGLRNSEGVVCAALFNSPEGFPNDPKKAVRSGCFPISGMPVSLNFADLPFGRYAVTVHHDENMDAKLNLGPLGIPKEGIGFSRNPKIWKGIPSFQRAEFEFKPDNTVISITMKYLLR